MSEAIEIFVEKFFSSVGAKVSKQDSLIRIENVPPKIEAFLGKKSPYLLAFENSLNAPPEAEIVTKGSFFLKAMNDYLNNKGQTTLLKIDFSDFLDKPLSFPGILGNCEVYKQEIKSKNKKIIRFTFQTIFQYLNEKESIISDIYVKEGKIFQIDLSKLKLLEGKPDEIKLDGIKEEFNIAKDTLKEILTPRIESLKKELEIELEKEMKRIENHYNSQKKELQLTLEKFEGQLKEAEKKNDSKKVSRLSQDIINLKERIENPQRKTEKEFLIQDEKNKHTINLFNKLLNTTIIYYPEFEFKITLRRDSAIKPISITIDPLDISISPLSCEGCQKNLSDIFLCTSGHLTCNSCLDSCPDCDNPLCKICSRKECKICSRKICRKCDRSCASCFAVICKTHSKEEKSTMRNVCVDCAKQCSSCLNWFRISRLAYKNGKSICGSCKTQNLLKKSN